MFVSFHDALEGFFARVAPPPAEPVERDEDMILATPAPRIWTLRDVQEAAAKRRAEEFRNSIFYPPVTMVIVDESEIEETE